ncbi:dihydroxyacetone kinase phosphoryl donor subunit DhaM [Stomatohabitans albus]|uniref:dihydroxyacetone kinase phosphoryl donor subunit DhaM n=1 Tax=Stomatohabitans albus TaxID=3110766 RepID=UPI00300D8323
MTVGIVVVSHSEKIAEGTVELAAQMAADVTIKGAGGTDDGRIGTSFNKVMDAIQNADSGDGVVVLTDLGSAVLTTESVMEFLDDELRDRVRMVNESFIKGTIAAATTAQGGGDLDACARAAEMALHPSAEPNLNDTAETRAVESQEGDLSTQLTLTNALGLHARPAARLAELVNKSESRAWVNGHNAGSALSMMTLQLKEGDAFEFRANGPDAQALIDQVTALVIDNFGE